MYENYIYTIFQNIQKFHNNKRTFHKYAVSRNNNWEILHMNNNDAYIRN